jgi:ribose transport system substrate-binding protein
MRGSRCIGLAAAVVVSGGLVAACGSDDSGSKSGGSGKSIAFAQMASSNDSWKAQTIGVRAAAKTEGVDLLVGDAGGDVVKQNSNVQTFITKGVGALILNPADPVGVGPSVKALKSADIPLVVVNNSLADNLKPDSYCYVAEDQVATGALVGTRMATVLAKKYGADTTLKGVILGGVRGDVITPTRSSGFKKGYASVKGAPKLKLLPTIYGQWAADKALPPVREIATANPDLKVIFVASDSMLPAVESALKPLNLWDKVTIGSYDGEMLWVKKMMDDPTGPIVGIGANVPNKQGELALKIAKQAAAGTPASKACPGGTKFIQTPLYTPENAKQYYKAGQAF